MAHGQCEVEIAQVRPGRINWARLLKRVFDIDKQHCPNRGAGELKIIAAILARPVIQKILDHLGVGPSAAAQGSGTRAGAAGAALRRLSRVRRQIHIAIGCTATLQPGWRCASCRHIAADGRVNPAIKDIAATCKRSKPR